jgi:hypothetical protein
MEVKTTTMMMMTTIAIHLASSPFLLDRWMVYNQLFLIPDVRWWDDNFFICMRMYYCFLYLDLMRLCRQGIMAQAMCWGVGLSLCRKTRSTSWS